MPSGPQLPASQFDSWYPNPERLDVAILLLVGSHGAASPPTRLAVAPLCIIWLFDCSLWYLVDLDGLTSCDRLIQLPVHCGLI